MQESYSAAFSEGTRQNHYRQAKAYLTFMLASTFSPLAPTVIQILLYIQFLANSFKTVLTVKNYLSGAKSFVTQQGAPTHQFSSPLISNLFKGLARMSMHVPTQAPPLRVNDIKRICDILAVMDDGARVARTAILMAFATFLRQSNLLPTAGSTAGHCIRRGDVHLEDGQLWITINSSKTISDPRDRVCIPVFPPNSRHCPASAWLQYIQYLPLPSYFPAFMLTASIPLTPNRLTSYLRGALVALGHPHAATVTIHPLRRSGARESAAGGADESEVMTHGTWTSSAVTSYVPKKLYTRVPQIMSRLFGPQ